MSPPFYIQRNDLVNTFNLCPRTICLGFDYGEQVEEYPDDTIVMTTMVVESEDKKEEAVVETERNDTPESASEESTDNSEESVKPGENNHSQNDGMNKLFEENESAEAIQGKYNAFAKLLTMVTIFCALTSSLQLFSLHFKTLHRVLLHVYNYIDRILHCTALHCTALHCTALHCTALHCTALHCTALH